MPVPARPTHLDPAIGLRLKRDADGLFAGGGPAVGHRRGADGRLDGRRGAAPHPDDRPLHLLEPQPAEYWVKGETSGHQQWVKSVALDCDGDTVLVKVDQVGAACHTGDRTCFDAGATSDAVVGIPAP